MLITKQTTINKIITLYPETIRFFDSLKMSCGGCFAVKFDTIENGALMHGMDVNTLIEKLDLFISTLPNAVSVEQQN